MQQLKSRLYRKLIKLVAVIVTANVFFNLFPTLLVYLLTNFSINFAAALVLGMLAVYFVARLVSDFATKKSELLFQVLSEFHKSNLIAKMLKHSYSSLQEPHLKTKLANSLFTIDNQGLFLRYYDILVSLVYTGVTLLLSAAIVSKVNPVVALTCVSIVALSIVVNQLKKKLLLKRTRKLLKINKVLDYFEQIPKAEHLLADNKIYNMASKLEQQYREQTDAINRSLRSGAHKVAILDGISSWFGVLSFVVGAGLLLYLDATKNFAQLSIAITALFTFVSMIESSFTTYLQLLSLKAQMSSFEELGKLQAQQVEFDDSSDYAVELRNVSFSYPGGAKIIDDLSMTIKKGETVALVGENGSGKTTLIGIIAGILEPQAGTVANGIGHNYAFVQQEAIQFPETIAANIVVAQEYDDAKINQVLTAVNLDGVILGGVTGSTIAKDTFGAADNKTSNANDSDLANAIDGITGNDENIVTSDVNSSDQIATTLLHRKLNPAVHAQAIALSGGQFQRLTIARGLYRDSQLLILDEPTASLDIANENTIFKTIASLDAIETKVFISHRLANCQIADTIYYLQDGKIVEVGSHDQLVARRGAYYDLFSKQSRIYVADDVAQLTVNLK